MIYGYNVLAVCEQCDWMMLWVFSFRNGMFRLSNSLFTHDQCISNFNYFNFALLLKINLECRQHENGMTQSIYFLCVFEIESFVRVIDNTHLVVYKLGFLLFKSLTPNIKVKKISTGKSIGIDQHQSMDTSFRIFFIIFYRKWH